MTGSFAGVLFRTAIDQLDGAPIGTLHAFAQRILMENPVEAGLPPRLEVLDEVSSDVAFDRRWQSFRDELLTDPELEPSILMLLATRRAATRRCGCSPRRSRTTGTWSGPCARSIRPSPRVSRTSSRTPSSSIEAVCERTPRARCSTSCCERLEQLAAYVERLRGCADDVELVEQVDRAQAELQGQWVRQARNWQDKRSVADDISRQATALDAAVDAVGQAAVRRIATAMRAFTLRAADERRVSGELAFHDLLVLARSLLRDPEHGAAVRTRLHERYTRLLLDEFQDTDPIQIELATRIAAADPARPRRARPTWFELDLAPGHLFMVGDPKQSIYRFRRADISVFMAARDRFGADGGGLVQLTANFRSCAPIIGWVNATFGELIGDGDDAGPVASQPPYVGLDAVRDEPPVGPPVSVVGRQALDGVRRRRAAGGRGRRGGRHDRPHRRRGVERRGRRRAERLAHGELGDITILVPDPHVAAVPRDRSAITGIAYRAESSSLVYVTQAVRDLLMTLRAVDDPTDHLRIVSALRTPLFACGDDDLFRFKRERGGHWGYTGDQPDTVPRTTRCGSASSTCAPCTSSASGPRPRSCSSASPATGAPSRSASPKAGRVTSGAVSASSSTRRGTGPSRPAGASASTSSGWSGSPHEGARVAEAVLPETDDDAVRIMTIHAAKGLEFPITIVSGMSTGAGRPGAAAEVVFPPAAEPGTGSGARSSPTSSPSGSRSTSR